MKKLCGCCPSTMGLPKAVSPTWNNSGYRRSVMVAGSRLNMPRRVSVPGPSERWAMGMSQLVEKNLPAPRGPDCWMSLMKAAPWNMSDQEPRRDISMSCGVESGSALVPALSWFRICRMRVGAADMFILSLDMPGICIRGVCVEELCGEGFVAVIMAATLEQEQAPGVSQALLMDGFASSGAANASRATDRQAGIPRELRRSRETNENMLSPGRVSSSCRMLNCVAIDCNFGPLFSSIWAMNQSTPVAIEKTVSGNPPRRAGW